MMKILVQVKLVKKINENKLISLQSPYYIFFSGRVWEGKHVILYYFFGKAIQGTQMWFYIFYVGSLAPASK